MAKFPTYEEMAKKVAEKVLDGYIYKGKTLREWIDILAQAQWIPVSERLPKENGRYLCTVGTDYRNPREMCYEPKGKNNRTWALLDRTYVEDCFVTAWMPFPESYKGE